MRTDAGCTSVGFLVLLSAMFSMFVWACTVEGCGGSYQCEAPEQPGDICTCGHRDIREDEIAKLPRSPEEVRASIPVEVTMMAEYCDPRRGRTQVALRFVFDPVELNPVKLVGCDVSGEVEYVVETGCRLFVSGEGVSWAAYFPAVTVLIGGKHVVPTWLDFGGTVTLADLKTQPEAQTVSELLEASRRNEGWAATDEQTQAVFAVRRASIDSSGSLGPIAEVYLWPTRDETCGPFCCVSAHPLPWLEWSPGDLVCEVDNER